jgi:ethanolamine ammonia-lyase large subunit
MLEIGELKRVFARANDFKEGDLPLGGTTDEALRRDAKKQVAALRIKDLAGLEFVEDELTQALARSLDRRRLDEIAQLSIGQVKAVLLGEHGASWAARFRAALPSEAIAALVKTMSDDELSRVARDIFNALPGQAPVAVGSVGHLGSRIQPNSPGDDEEEILLSTLEGLAYGCGDVIIGLNPASDDVETIVRTEKLLAGIVERLQLPTRYCVLSDMVKQSKARTSTKVDVGFQSLAGTSKALVGMLGLDVGGLLELAQGFAGLYFETGQGSEATNGAAEGFDMVTLESRCYGLARYIRQQCGGRWTIVNDVAGFIGPEVFRTGAQLMRACLEDAVMAKLHGLTMGLDVCSTFHMGISPEELQALTEDIVEKSAPAYLMSVAGNADPMLGYLTTSFRQHPRLRRAAGKRPTSAMESRLRALGAIDAGGLAAGEPETTAGLYAQFMKAGGDGRDAAAIKAEGLRKLAALKDRGWDLGYGLGADRGGPPQVRARLEAIYRNARSALYAGIAEAVIRDSCPRHIAVATESADREDFLAHPASGERIAARDAAVLKRLYGAEGGAPQIALVVSDGLNADAVNEQLRGLLPRLRWSLGQAGLQVGKVDVVVKNGRVRAGYHAAELIGPELLIHLIGERPGTGLNQLSAYLTYGRDPSGRFRWGPAMDHSFTSAICGIHPQGKTPRSASDDIVSCVQRMLKLKCSGVSLGRGLGAYDL